MAGFGKRFEKWEVLKATHLGAANKIDLIWQEQSLMKTALFPTNNLFSEIQKGLLYVLYYLLLTTHYLLVTSY